MAVTSKRYLVVPLGLLLLFVSWQIVWAEPAPDKLVVNHETKECAHGLLATGW